MGSSEPRNFSVFSPKFKKMEILMSRGSSPGELGNKSEKIYSELKFGAVVEGCSLINILKPQPPGVHGAL